MEIDFSGQIKSMRDSSVEEIPSSPEEIDPEVLSSDQLNIEISKKIIFALGKKADGHNESGLNKQVTIEQLKKVYKKGAEKCSPDKTKNQCALARVNLFLSMISGSPIKEIIAETKASRLEDLDEIELEEENYFTKDWSFDITEDWAPSESAFKQADEDVRDYDLSFDFIDIEDLYLEETPMSTTSWTE